MQMGIYTIIYMNTKISLNIPDRAKVWTVKSNEV